jgi:hypothetical protein
MESSSGEKIKMIRHLFALIVLVLLAPLSCFVPESNGSQTGVNDKSFQFTVFYTGNVFGELEACG